MKSLTNKVVVITGASSGIGRACALQFGRAGAHAVVAARRMDRLEQVRAEVEETGAKCLAVRTDVADRALVQRLLDATIEHFGRVDVWINNAGFGLVGTIEQTSEEEMRRLWEVNYLGAFHGCQVALQQMRRQGSGHIINVSSMAGRFALPLGGAYASTKFAMNALGQSLDLEMRLGKTGIRVSTVMPGYTRTEFSDALIRKFPRSSGGIGPEATADQVARAIVKCALRTRTFVMLCPVPKLTLALTDLLPAIFCYIARKYVDSATDGRGIPDPNPPDSAR